MNRKYCVSPKVIEFGTFDGVQRYWCRDRKRKFADDKALPTMKTPMEHTSAALSYYFECLLTAFFMSTSGGEL
jgi:hypothetical protein